MSHKYRKPKPISAGKAKSAPNAITHGLAASTLVLRTESKEKYEALLASYREKCKPDGPIENDLVEEIVAAKWQQRRVAMMITALIDVTMDRMEKQIRDQFENIDNAVRTVLAFDKQAAQSATLALLNRYANRHARDYHRALRQLREIQSDRPDDVGPTPGPRRALRPPNLATEAQPSEATSQLILQNEPKPDVTPEPSTACEYEATVPDPATDHQSELATSHKPLATSDPLATRHSQLILQNEPKSGVTPEPSTACECEATVPDPATGHQSELATSHESRATSDPLATRHSPLATQTAHQPQATGHCEAATDHQSEPATSHESRATSDPLATRHSPLATQTAHQPPPTDHRYSG